MFSSTGQCEQVICLPVGSEHVCESNEGAVRNGHEL